MRPLPYLLAFLFITGCQSIWRPGLSALDLKEDMSDVVTLVNLKHLKRVQIANLLQEISAQKPRAIGINAQFTHTKDPKGDSLLTLALATHGVHTVAIADSIQGDSIVRQILPWNALYLSMPPSHNNYYSLVLPPFEMMQSFIPFLRKEDTVSYHIAYSLASSFAPDQARNFTDKALRYIRMNQKFDIPIVFSRTADLYLTLSPAEVGSQSSKYIKDRIVILGYLGPEDEDKKFTPLRYTMENVSGSDTYVTVITANIVEQILDGRIDPD
ncbi:MAG: CHASE2 domain-containing protein [Cyclobacteriaceae bacterium]|nr:CHASE2 domain-containing protein [Cyclobacteriaceae bacterium HetDA_MAG_MS6]